MSSRKGPRSLPSLVALAFVAACSGTLTDPQRIEPKSAAKMIAADCSAIDECVVTNAWYDPPMDVSDQTDITAQDNFVATWMNSSEFRDTLPGVIIDAYQPGEQYCVTNGYVNQYNGQISGNCPTGPCYDQWKGMKNAGVSWTGLVNGLLMGGFAVRNSWGLFSISLPASTSLLGAWGNVEDMRKKYVMCMSQDDKYYFYYPSAWNDPSPYAKPRYPDGMPR